MTPTPTTDVHTASRPGPQATRGMDWRDDPSCQSLDPRHVTVERVVGWILFLATAMAAGLGLAAAVLATWPPGLTMGGIALLVVLLLVLMAWWVHAWPAVAHRWYRYRADAKGLEIYRGVLWRSMIHVPRIRIQHSDIRQGPLQRRFGLGKLVVHTAGTEYAAIELDGLAHEEALRLRDLLTAEHIEDAAT